MPANLSFLQPAQHRPRLSEEQIQHRYPRLRWQIMEATFLGYATFYLVRNNLALVQKEMGAAVGYNLGELGDFLAATAVAYGVGKFLMGAWSDRSNPRRFMPLGLLLTALCNFAFGASNSYWMHLGLWTLNGLVQGMGWPPCGRSLGHWYSENERGLKFSIWNCAHNIGGAGIGYLAAWLNANFGWQSAFYVPGLIALFMSGYLLWRLRDTPQSEGLPPIEEYRNDYPPGERRQHETELSFKELIVDNVLKNRVIWIFAIANFFVYIARYAMIDWGPSYLKIVKGVDIKGAGLSTVVLELAAIPSTILIGYYSDRLAGRRGLVSLLCMVVVAVAFAAIVFAPGSAVWVDFIAFAVIGCFVYPAVALLGVAGLDFTSKKAVGAAAGFIGLMGYLGRSTLGKLVGELAKISWNHALLFIFVSTLLAVFMLLFTVRLRPRG